MKRIKKRKLSEVKRECIVDTKKKEQSRVNRKEQHQLNHGINPRKCEHSCGDQGSNLDELVPQQGILSVKLGSVRDKNNLTHEQSTK